MSKVEKKQAKAKDLARQGVEEPKGPESEPEVATADDLEELRYAVDLWVNVEMRLAEGLLRLAVNNSDMIKEMYQEIQKREAAVKRPEFKKWPMALVDRFYDDLMAFEITALTERLAEVGRFVEGLDETWKLRKECRRMFPAPWMEEMTAFCKTAEEKDLRRDARVLKAAWVRSAEAQKAFEKASKAVAKAFAKIDAGLPKKKKGGYILSRITVKMAEEVCVKTDDIMVKHVRPYLRAIQKSATAIRKFREAMGEWEGGAE